MAGVRWGPLRAGRRRRNPSAGVEVGAATPSANTTQLGLGPIISNKDAFINL